MLNIFLLLSHWLFKDAAAEVCWRFVLCVSLLNMEDHRCLMKAVLYPGPFCPRIFPTGRIQKPCLRSALLVYVRLHPELNLTPIQLCCSTQGLTEMRPVWVGLRRSLTTKHSLLLCVIIVRGVSSVAIFFFRPFLFFCLRWPWGSFKVLCSQIYRQFYSKYEIV